MVTALAQAFSPWPPTVAAADGERRREAAGPTDAALANQLAAAFARRPDYRALVRALLDGGVPGACASCAVTVGTPLMPMLGRIAR